jgi:hypothetical protein
VDALRYVAVADERPAVLGVEVLGSGRVVVRRDCIGPCELGLDAPAQALEGDEGQVAELGVG